MEKNTSKKAPADHNLYSWRSLNRQQRQYSKEVFTTLGAVVLLVSIILAFFQEWLAIFVAWAALFLFWQLSRLSPVEVDHKITSDGVLSMGHGYLWADLGPFWFTQKGQETTLHIAHRNVFGQLIIIVNSADQEKIRDILAVHLPYIELPEKSAVERMSQWFAKKFPLEPQKPQVAV